MNKVYVCGSFRFSSAMEDVERVLKDGGIDCLVSKSAGSEGLLGCLRRIDGSDAVYVVNPGGYVGKSVSLDIGYALAKNIPVFTMNPVEDPPIMDLLSGVMSPESLLRCLFKRGAPKA